MTLDVKVLGNIRGGNVPVFSEGVDEELQLNNRADLIVAQGLPPLTEIVRMGYSNYVITSAAVAPITVLPTTTAQLTLWNGELDGGKSYVIDSVGAIVVVSAAAATGLGIAVLQNTARVASPTASGLVTRGLSGKAARTTSVTGLAVTVADEAWQPVGSAPQATTTSQIGMTIDVPLGGMFICPPGRTFSTAVLANTASTITVRQFIRWHEVQLTLG